MKTIDFLQSFHDYMASNGYSFYFEDKQFEQPEKMSSGGRLLVKIAIGSALSLVNPGFGTLAVLNSGLYETFKNESFVEDMKKLKTHCELLSIKEFPFVVDLEDGEIKYAGSRFFGLSYWSTLAGKMSKEIFRK